MGQITRRGSAAPALPVSTIVVADAPDPGRHQPLTAGVITLAQFTRVDQGEGFDLATNTWTCPATGEYFINVGAQIELNGGSEYYVFIFLNGNRVRDMLFGRAHTYGYWGGVADTLLRLNAGDTVDIRVYSDSAGATLIGAPFRTFAAFSRRL